MRILTCIILLAAVATAQEFRGTILGRITDPSGAVVPGGKVTVTNEETNIGMTASSNQEGNYIVPFLLPGRYRVVADAAGFKKVVRAGVTVQVNDRITLDLALEVGAAADTITITAETPMLQAASADLGQVVERRFIDRLPMSGRNAMNLADLAPGVVAGSGGYTSNSQNDISVNGGSGDKGGNDVTVDGIPNINPRQGGLAVTPPISEAVEEFKVVTTMFDASNGRSNGGALAFSTKSGTNQYHGEFHDFYQNRALNATSWTNNSQGLAKPAVHYNLWGGTVGGPVRLPKYNGRDRTFFFFGWEQTDDQRADTRFGRVPTELEKQGDFSQTLATNGSPIAIYDPYSTVVDANNKATRTAFAGAKIPAARLSPTGVALFGVMPSPNMGVAPRINQLNWVGNGGYYIRTRNAMVRLDQAISNRQRLYARFSALKHEQAPSPILIPGEYNLPSSSSARATSNLNNNPRFNKSFALDDAYSFTPTFFASLRYGYARSRLLEVFDGTDRDPAELKLPDIIIKNQTRKQWPVMNLGENIPYVGGPARQSVNDTHALMATFNKLQGRHTLKFGMDYRLIRWNEAVPGSAQGGNFTFNSTFTRSDPASSSSSNSSGTSMASMLLGLPSAGNLGYVSMLSVQTNYASFFVQDDIKLTPKLTVNVGMRYELETPSTERFNRIGWGFDEKAAVPVTVPGMDLKGGLLFVGENGKGRRQGNTDYNNFGPRVGFAYTLNPKTVVRGGYGMFYESGIINLSNLGGVASFDAVTPFVASADSNRTPLNTLANPFPNGLVTPTGSSKGLASELGNAIRYLNPNRVAPYVQQWQFSIQRELGFQTVVEAAYVGSHSIKLYEDFNWNEKPDVYLPLGTAETAAVKNPFLGVFPATSTLGQGSTLPQSRFWARFPQFNQVNVVGLNTGRALYHGLQTRLQKRFSHGLSFVVSHAWSKNMEYNATSMVNERHYRTVSDFDFPHIFRMYATYEIPLGKGKAVGGNWPGWLNNMFGNWEMAWVWKLTSGTPLTISDRRGRPIPIANPVLGGSVADRLGDRKDPKTGLPLNPYFKTDVWQSLASDYSITPEPPRYGWLRGPRGRSTNLTIHKAFSIFERATMEVRGEINNPTNTPVFNDPSTDLSSPATFGVINAGGGQRTVQLGARIRF